MILAAMAALILGCESKTIEVPQWTLREAHHVFTATAADDKHTYLVEKVFKGRPEPRVSITWPKENDGSCDPYVPTTAGERYMVTIACNDKRLEGQTAVYDCAAAAKPLETSVLFRFLAQRQPVRRRDVTSMLRGWLNGTVSSEKLAQWVREMMPVADVGDDEHLLGIMQSLHHVFDEPNDCEIQQLRKNAPLVLRVLEARRLSEELIEELEAQWVEPDC